MRSHDCPEQFKIQAVKQVTEQDRLPTSIVFVTEKSVTPDWATLRCCTSKVQWILGLQD